MCRAALVVLVAAACGGSPSKRPASADRSGDSTPAAADNSEAPPESARPKKPVSFPAPPAGPPPTDTWRVTLEFPRVVGRARDIVADSSGVYLAVAVLSADDVRMQRWSVVKLDSKGAVAWSSIEDLPRAPAPQRALLVDGALIVGGQDSTYEATRLVLVERWEATSGKRTWRKRFTARDPRCNSQDCYGKDTFGSISHHAQTVYFAASVDRPIEGAFGEISVAKGAAKAYQTRTDRHGLDVGRDASGLYVLEETMSNVVSLIKLEKPEGKAAWSQQLSSNAQRMTIDPSGVILWGTTIEKRALETGELEWTSPLEGEHVDVAVAPSGIYVTTKLDAKPEPYFALARVDPATGAVSWLTPTSKVSEGRSSMLVAAFGEHVYLAGFSGELVFVEKRRNSDGALGEVTTAAHTIQAKRKK